MVNLGDKCRCKITGFEGVAVSWHKYLEGCERLTLQPAVDKDGKLPDCQSFDVPQLEVMAEKVAETVNGNVGGPEKYSDTGRR